MLLTSFFKPLTWHAKLVGSASTSERLGIRTETLVESIGLLKWEHPAELMEINFTVAIFVGLVPHGVDLLVVKGVADVV